MLYNVVMQATMMEGTAAANGKIKMDKPVPAPTLLDIGDEVRRLSSETSEKYVPAPSKGVILQDVLIGLKRFRNAVRLKWFWVEEARKKAERDPYRKGRDGENATSEARRDESEGGNDVRGAGNRGLGMSFRRPNNDDSAPITSKEVEVFLNELVEGVLHDLDGSEGPSETRKSKEIRRLEKMLGEDRLNVVVPTDKTNLFKLVKKKDYITWVG
jgi:hypothetical protein